MVFSFNILGLFIMFILIIYTKVNNAKEDCKYLFLGYLVEFLYILAYIGLNINRGMLVIPYFTVFIWLESLFLFEYSKNKVFKVFIILLDIIMGIVVCFNVYVSNMLVYGTNVISYISLFFAFLALMILLINKNLDNRKKLFIFNLIWIIGIVFCMFIKDMELYSSIIVILVMYMYLLFNNEVKIKKLEFERDYYKNNILDKESFLKNLSHEIRVPLNTIEGYSQILLDSKISDKYKNDINDIRCASGELIDVINSNIDLNIISSGRLELILDNYNIYDIFDNISYIISNKIDNKDLFVMNIDKEIPEVLRGDSTRISQIILGVLTNSIKHSNNKVTLNASCVKNNDKVRLLFNISDDYTKIESDINNNTLKIIKYLIKKMNGKFYVDNNGVNICINQDIISVSDNNKKSKLKEIKYFDASDKRILIVDDNKLNIKVILKLLEGYKVNITEATSGSEVINILDKDSNYDLILMDDLMPEMSGSDAMDTIRKIGRIDGYYIPIVVVTANASNGEKEEYIKKGFDDYLSKPIDKNELDRVITKYLK